ncbi:hypothetical protein [Brevibacillus dissolubilis]|nr:hypothetical protein [Brevibacillus dissolubilis]
MNAYSLNLWPRFTDPREVTGIIDQKTYYKLIRQYNNWLRLTA